MLDLKALLTKMLNVDANAPIGGYVFPDRSVPTAGGWRNISSFTLPKGIWMVTISVNFSTHATGYRQVTLGDNSTSAGAVIRTLRMPATNGANTNISMTFPVEGNATYYINVTHNAGTNLTVASRYTAVRLGASVNYLS